MTQVGFSDHDEVVNWTHEGRIKTRMTFADFVVRARAAHGDKYEYDETTWIGASHRVTITCPSHGTWSPIASSHYKGSGCQKCYGDRKKGTGHSHEEFAQRVRERFGSRYELLPGSYTGSKASVTLICPTHGRFEKKAELLLKSKGCQKCSREARAVTQVIPYSTFLERARAAHGTRYEYDESSYQGSAKKMSIICPEHGPFRMKPADHAGTARQGCPDSACSKPGKERLPFEGFLARARAAHGERYEYVADSYSQLDSKVTVICPDHGAFDQVARRHANGQGCRDCFNSRIGDRFAMGWSDFLPRAIEMHGGRYQYDESSYVLASRDMTIICAKHGPFQQPPTRHLAGQGCRDCSYDQRREAQTMPFAVFVEKARLVHGDQFDYIEESWTQAAALVTAVCKKHGEWTPQGTAHLLGSTCPRCKNSRGEKAVFKALTMHGVTFEHSWRHPDCRDKRPLPFDFMLPDQRVLIEFDGGQHRKPVKWSDSMTDEEAQRLFEGIQRRDAIKTEWAAANGWRLVRLHDARTVPRDLRRAGILPEADAARDDSAA